MADKQETPSAEVIAALQNRINDLEASLRAAEAERKAAPKSLERKDLDEAIAILKAEIEELKKEKKAVVKEEKKDKKDGEPGGEPEESLESGIKSLSIW